MYCGRFVAQRMGFGCEEGLDCGRATRGGQAACLWSGMDSIDGVGRVDLSTGRGRGTGLLQGKSRGALIVWTGAADSGSFWVVGRFWYLFGV